MAELKIPLGTERLKMDMITWLLAHGMDDGAEFIDNADYFEMVIKPVKEKSYRTSQQNRAMHLGLTNVARQCNERGISANQFFGKMQKSMQFETQMEHVKQVFGVICKALFGNESTTKIPIGELGTAWDVLAAAVADADRLGFDIGPLPNREELESYKESYSQYKEASDGKN
jgi:hypothetical protein